MTLLKRIFPKTIIIFGLGGGGSKTLSELVSFIYESYQRGLCGARQGYAPRIILVDYDTVEDKNCARQLYYPWDVGQLKVDALKSRYMGLLEIDAIPEASNADSLPKIFTPEVLDEPFCVISKLDRDFSIAQIYNWLVSAVPEDSTWFWFFSGTSLTEQSVQGTFRTIPEVSFKSPYVTAYMYGRIEGQAIIPELTDPRFTGVFPKPLPPHVAHQDIIFDTSGVTGVRSDGTGCGMAEEDQVEQSGLGNTISTAFTIAMMGALYYKGIVLPEMTFQNYQSSSTTPYTLDEVLDSQNNPGLKTFLEENQNHGN